MMRADADLPVLSQQLLLSVAEELKLPLLQIARQVEQGRLDGQTDLLAVQATADTALRLLDNYLLGVRLALEPQHFDIEPVSVSSVLYDTGQQLDAFAKTYGVSLELHVAGRYGTVMAHRQGLQAALTSLGAALIEALPALGAAPRQLTLQLATHRSRYGIVAGLYTETAQVTNEALRRGRLLQGRGRQPLLNLTHTSGAGIFVADAILQAMSLRLRASRHHGLYGLGAVLPSNNQLRLV
ncbi:MAG: hypothetical protein WA843_03700 [Candidatus Saccharimonadales bacterium]